MNNFIIKKKISSKVVYLWTYIVIARLYIAIIKWIYKIKSVRKFTKIWLFHSYFSIIFYSFFEERLYVDQVFFTKATWNSSINPNSLPVNLSCQITSTFKSIKSKLLSEEKANFLYKNIKVYCHEYFHLTKIICAVWIVCNIKPKHGLLNSPWPTIF